MLPPCVSCLFFSQWCLRLENPGLQEWWSRRSSSTSWWLASNSAFFTIAFSLSLGLQGDQRPTHMHAVRRERERKLIRWTKRLEGGPTTSVSTIAKIVLSSVWFLTSSLWTLAWTAFVFRREREGRKTSCLSLGSWLLHDSALWEKDHPVRSCLRHVFTRICGGSLLLLSSFSCILLLFFFSSVSLSPCPHNFTFLAHYFALSLFLHSQEEEEIRGTQVKAWRTQAEKSHDWSQCVLLFVTSFSDWNVFSHSVWVQHHV